MATSRAATTKLLPGEHSIDRAKPFPLGDGYALRWRLRLHSGRLLDKTTKGPSKAVVRQRARATAKELLKGSHGHLKASSPVIDYLNEVTSPLLTSGGLSESTQRRYRLAYDLLRGKCSQDHSHAHSLAGLSIADAMRPRALKACLEEIATLHGAQNAKHARIVAKRYLAAQLVIDELIDHNPLADLQIDYTVARQPAVKRGGHALTLDEYKAVVNWLLTADPHDVPKPLRGRWTHEDRVTERRAVIDLILTQATTGLRTSEAAQRRPRDLEALADGTVVFHLDAVATKTRRGRTVPVIDPLVSQRLSDRLSGLPAGAWLFGAPTDPTKPWEPRNRDRKVAEVYQLMAADLGIPVLKIERGHIWRATLNTLAANTVPEDVRIRMLGHTADVNRTHYTGITSTERLVEAFRDVLNG